MIRRAVPNDLDAIEAMLPGLIKAMRAAGNDQWGPHYPQRADFAQDLADGVLFIDEVEGTVRGFAALNEVEPTEYDSLPWSVGRPALVVHRLAVAPAFQRQGVADGLFEYAEELARTKNYTGLRSDTSEVNRGMNALFTRRGWSTVGGLRFPHATVSFVAWEKRLL